MKVRHIFFGILLGSFLLMSTMSYAQIYSYFTNTIVNKPYTELPTNRVVLPAENFRDPLNPASTDRDDGFYYNAQTGEFGIRLPFEFEFDGRRYTKIQVNVNGFVQVGDLPAVFGTNDPNNMFSKNSPNGVIAPFWGDHYYRTPMDINFVPSEISYMIEGQPGSRVITIQWKNLNINYFFDPTDPNNPNAANPAPQPSSIGNFQVKIYESPAVGEPKIGDQGNIEFHYGIVGGIPGIVKVSGSAVGLESVSLTQGGGTSFMNGLFIEDSTSSAYIPNFDGQDSVIHSRRLTTVWPPSRANNNVIVFVATPKPGIEGWGDGDANLSQIPGNRHAGLPQNRFVTVNDVLEILRAVAMNQPLDSLMFREAFHADVNHNGRFWYSSRKMDNSDDSLDQNGQLVIYRREWKVKSVNMYDDLPADNSRNNLFFQANEYDAALILNYIAGKVPTLPWLLDTIPGYGKAATSIPPATGIQFGEVSVLENGFVAIPVALNGTIEQAFSVACDLGNGEIVNFISEPQSSDQMILAQWSAHRIAIAGSGAFQPGVIGKLLVKPFGSVLRFDQIRFNEQPRATTTIFVDGNTAPKVGAFPNPFESNTAIVFTAQKAGEYRVVVINQLGQIVKEVWSGSVNANEELYVSWDGTNHAGNPVGNGLYFFGILHNGKQISTISVVKK